MQSDSEKSDSSALPFSVATRAWFDARFGVATDVQTRGWAAIARGAHALLLAPTGSGKTLAAFLWAIDRLSADPAAAGAERASCTSRRSRRSSTTSSATCARRSRACARSAEALGLPLRALRVDVRTGDTPQRERAPRQARSPGEILVTTPESLYLILGSTRARRSRGVDDDHRRRDPRARAEQARRAPRALARARCASSRRAIRSASASPRPRVRSIEVARFLGGRRVRSRSSMRARRRASTSRSSVPVPDMEHVPPPARGRARPTRGRGAARGAPVQERGMWPAIYPELLERIRAERSTIVFVNSRGLCERLCAAPERARGRAELVRAHHGSVAHEQRARDRGGAQGRRPARASSPPARSSSASTWARSTWCCWSSRRARSRAGCSASAAPGTASARSRSARMYPKYRGDLLEGAVVAERMLAGDVEAMSVPRNALDVLAQQIVAMCCDASAHGRRARAPRAARVQLRATSRATRSTACSTCSRAATPRRSFAELRPRLAWDRAARRAERAPRRALLALRVAAGRSRIAALRACTSARAARASASSTRRWCTRRDRATRSCSASSTWRVESITRDRVIVSPAPGEPGRLPFWRGEGPGRPLELGRALGAFVRELGERAPADAERHAARALAARRATRRRTSSPTCTSSARTPARCRPIARSRSSASATSSATGASASSRRSARACTRRGRSPCSRC